MPMSKVVLRIREFREAKGWSQAELSRRAKVRTAALSRMETGKAQRIELDMLGRIADALGVDAALLVGRA